MKTINQINSFVERDATIQFYCSLGTQANRWNNYKNRSFDFCYHYEGKKIPRNISPAGTWIYGQAVRQFNRYTGLKEEYNSRRRRDTVEISFQGSKLIFSLNLDVYMTEGVTMMIDSNFRIDKEVWYPKFAVKSNSTFEALNIADYFRKKILPKYIYPAGLFRNIQIIRNCSKKEALEFYLEYVKPKKAEVYSYVDTEKAWKKRFLRHLNIEIADDISERLLPGVFKTIERQKTRRKLFKHPSAFSLSEMYSSEYDEDGQEENFLNEFYSEYPKNAMFI